MAGPLGSARAARNAGCAEGGQELTGLVEGAGVDAPLGLAPEHLGRQVGDRVGDEGAGDRRLELALGAVGQQGPAGSDRGGGVGEVVGDDLVLVDRSGGGQRPRGGVHDLVGEVEDGLRRGQVGACIRRVEVVIGRG